MGESIYKELEAIAQGLNWLGKYREAQTIVNLAAKLKHYEIEGLEILDIALIEYRDKRLAEKQATKSS